jgi:hypothetical protein
MALRQIRIGSSANVIQYDDAGLDSAIECSEPIKSGAPVDLNDVLRLGDIATSILGIVYPIGGLYFSVLSTNPNTLLGFGTWVRVAEAQYLVGFKTGDADFGVVEATGGNKNHIHAVDVGITTSGASSANGLADNNGDGTTFSVATGMATHDVDPASVNSGNNSALPPFYVLYIWKRTA